jgi:general secretion pathway protein G
MPVEGPNELFVRRNPLAMWSFGLGVAGFFLSAVVVGGVMGIVAVALGIVALRGSSKRSFAVGGIVSGGAAVPASVVALVVWTSVAQVRDSFYGAAAEQTTRETIGSVASALKTFEVDVGRYPTTEEGLEALMQSPNVTGWQGPYLARRPVDAWGWPLVYRFSGTGASAEFELYSVGPDGVADTGDDVRKDDTH